MLKEKLQQDLKDALKGGDSQKRTVIGMVLAAIKNREFDKRTKLSKTEKDVSKLEEQSNLNEKEIIETISSEIKKRKDSIEQYKKGGRPELAEKEKKEAEILMVYMPEQMSEEQIRDEVKKGIAEIRSASSGQVGAKDVKEMGKVLGAVMPKLKGKADGQTVSRIVKEELAK